MSGTAEAVTALVFDATPAAQGAAQFDAAGQKIITTNTAVVNATARTVDAQGNMERALARLTRQIDPAAAAQAKLEAGQRLLERAFQRGSITADEQARSLAMLDAKFGASAASAQRMSEASVILQQRMAAAAAAADKAAASQDAFNRALGVRPTNPDDTAKRASDLAAYGAEMDRIRAKFDPLFAAQQRYRAALAEIAQAERVGALATTQATAAREATKAGFAQQVVAMRAVTDEGTKGARNYGAALGQAGFQIQDFAVQVQGGTSAITALSQQGSQMLGVFGTGGAIAGAVLVVGLLASQLIVGKDAATLLTEALKEQEDQFAASNERATRMEETLRRQGDNYRTATIAGERYRAGLLGEGETLVRLAQYYDRLTASQRAAEGVTLERQRQTLSQGGNTIMGEITSRISGRIAAAEGGLSVGESGIGEVATAIGNLPAQVQQAVEAIQRFRDAGRITVEAFSELITAVNAARTAGGENSAELNRYETALVALIPRVREYEEAMRRLGVQQQAQVGQSRELVALEAMRGVTSEVGGTYQTRQRIEGQRGRIRDGLNSGLATPEDRAAARSSLQSLAQQSEGLTPASEQMLRGLREQIALSRTAEGAARELAQAELELNRASRATGQGMASANQIAEARGLVQERLTNDFVNFITTQHQVAVGTKAQADAMRDGAAAADNVRIEYEAQTQALRYAAAGTEAYARMVEILTGQMTQQRDAQQALNAARTVSQQEQQLAFIERETELVGAGVVVRERELAILRERQRIIASGEAAPAADDPRLLNAGRIAEATQALERQRSVYSEIQRVGEQAFDRIGSAITAAFANGTLQTLKFGNIAKAVVSEIAQAFLRLSVINPLKNALLGANAPTIGGVGSLFSFGGTMGGAAGVANAGSTAGALQQGQQSLGLYSAGRYGNLGQAFTMPGAMANTGVGFIDGALNYQLINSASSNATAGIAGAGLEATGGLFPGAGADAIGGAQTAISGAGLSPGLTLGNAVGGAAGIAGGAYSIYSGVQKGGVGGAAQVGSGVISAGLGAATIAAAFNPAIYAALAAMGPYGWAAAAILAIAGALLPGEKASGKGQEARLDLATGAQEFNGLGGKRFSQENRDAAENTVNSIADMARQLGDRLGGSRLGGQIAVGVTSSRGNGPGTLYLDINGRKDQFSNDEGGSKALATAAADIIFNEYKQKFAREGRTDETAAILFNSANVQALEENLQWYEQVYKAFEKTGEAADKTAQAVKAVEDQFNPLIDKAASLSLSTAMIVEARDKEIESVKKALAEAEAARLREIASIRATITARELATRGQFDYEAAQFAGQVARSQAWAEELRGLEQRLTALGETTANVAAEVKRLTDVQAAEYWANFASSMSALDQSVISRILRANGRTGEADRIDFEAGATAQIAALRKALADLGLSAEIAAVKVAETQQAIDAERMARARAANDQIVALDQSVISRILRATGRGSQADIADFEAAAAREVVALARSLDDLGFSAAVIAKKIAETEQAIGAERIALQQRIADESSRIQQDQLRATLAAGQSIRDYLNGLQSNSGPGGVSAQQALANARATFTTDRELANQGDAGALARVTGSAERLLAAAQVMYASGAEYQAIRATVVERLGALGAVEAVDARTRGLTGFATGGSFTVAGMAGNDNLSLANVRVTAGETVSVSRRDTMGDVVTELRTLRREVAQLRQERAASSERQTQVIAAVGTETVRRGDETNAILRGQADAQRLAGAA